ncbi:MAG: HypC/HybG/HupF family hydrogenase formation chaperone [Parvularcula sp.]|jgi:hydrogenase expression/formation protein HypC|nr:HypC/HybG/HupF family hydrogenase formation chaperone [Parvularcula sp.]
MCLGIPGQIVSISDAEKKLAMVDVSGVQREINVACIMPEGGKVDDLIGAWALIHVGFAMSRIDEEEAAKTLEILMQLGEAQAEIEAMRDGKAAMEEAS